MKKTRLCFVLIIVLSFLFSGCKKEDELLKGVWQRIYPEEVEWDDDKDDWDFGNRVGDKYVKEKWHFMEDNKLMIRHIYDSNQEDKDYHGYYTLKPIFKTTFLAIDGIPVANDFLTYNTDWRIHTLDGEKLIIYHDDEGGVLLRELIKID